MGREATSVMAMLPLRALFLAAETAANPFGLPLQTYSMQSVWLSGKQIVKHKVILLIISVGQINEDSCAPAWASKAAGHIFTQQCYSLRSK
jgi:hypothetical protein